MMKLEAKWVSMGLVKVGASRAFLPGWGKFISNERDKHINCLF